MTAAERGVKNVHRHFVDEAGDPTLFGARGKILVGTEGCSKFFMLGVAHIAEPERIAESLNQLRADLLQDPYFRGVPSFNPAQKKTALCFHAKDDLPEVRREVFRLLSGFEIRAHAIVRDKTAVVQEVRERQKTETRYRYRPDDIYDDCTRLIFQDLLHQADENEIVFARRGKTSRIAALGETIEQAKSHYEHKSGQKITTPIKIEAAYPSESAGLQAMDYCLWALQRKYERDEERFYEMMRSKFEAIIEIDVPSGEG